jgi:hypothetical protein
MKDSRFYWIKWNQSKEMVVAEKKESGWYIPGWEISVEESKFTVVKKLKPPEITKEKR